jgi:hypothetical protein
MTEVVNQVTTQTAGFAPSVVLSYACDAGSLTRPLEEQFCCGERLEPRLREGGYRVARCRRCLREWFEQGQIHDARSPWIGVDLDGTLAADTGGELWDAGGQPKIGKPVEKMVARIKRWIAGGRTVKIFTARASSPAQVRAIRSWLTTHGLPDLEVTNVKDFNLIELWDDRCVEVARNSGCPVNQDRMQRPGRSRTRSQGSHRRKEGFRLLFSLKQIFLTL